MNRSLIITAGGIGKRMGTSTPKQFLTINNRPVLFYTIERFLEFDDNLQIVLVLPEDHLNSWTRLCVDHDFKHHVEIIAGGKERFHSVKNGLRLATGDLIAVHDAVRPFVSINVIAAAFHKAEENGAAVPVVSPSESLRKLKDHTWVAVDRADYALVQTPQVFKKELLVKAYEQGYNPSFTDDASVVESNGSQVYIVEGNDENIKITTPLDFKLAELLANAR